MLLSICIGNRGRWPFLNNCLISLGAALKETKISTEIIIAEWPAETGNVPDRGSMSAALGHPWSIALLKQSGAFTRGGARNRAAEKARGKILFFLDADMLVTPGVLTRGIYWAKQGRVFFPGYDFQTKDGGLQRGTGTGNCFLLRELYEKNPTWPEYERYGGEDTRFAHHYKIMGLNIREYIPGFVHQYHGGHK